MTFIGYLAIGLGVALVAALVIIGCLTVAIGRILSVFTDRLK